MSEEGDRGYIFHAFFEFLTEGRFGLAGLAAADSWERPACYRGPPMTGTALKQGAYRRAHYDRDGPSYRLAPLILRACGLAMKACALALKARALILKASIP